MIFPLQIPAQVHWCWVWPSTPSVAWWVRGVARCGSMDWFSWENYRKLETIDFPMKHRAFLYFFPLNQSNDSRWKILAWLVDGRWVFLHAVRIKNHINFRCGGGNPWTPMKYDWFNFDCRSVSVGTGKVRFFWKFGRWHLAIWYLQTPAHHMCNMQIDRQIRFDFRWNLIW